MSSLPFDSASDILATLPVKDLLRFRCVSTSFCSLIDSPYFTKLHLSRSEKTRSGYLFILESIDEIKSLDFDSLEEGPEIFPPPVKPPSEPYYKTEIVDSYNGVVVLFSGKGAPLLWNPFTRKIRELPSCEITDLKEKHCRTKVVHGLGYDYETDDYKLVQIAYFLGFSGNPNISKVAVFGLKANTWKEIECPPSISFDSVVAKQNGAFVNNALHWIRFSEPVGSMIAAFDLAKEEFYLVPHPDFGLGVHNLVVLRGCLAMVNNNHGHDAGLNVWVMKDYGVNESWSKLLFLPECRLSMSVIFPTFVYPIAYSRDGKKILLNHGCLNHGCHLTWYDPMTKTLDIVYVLDDGDCAFNSSLFMESLVALD